MCVFVCVCVCVTLCLFSWGKKEANAKQGWTEWKASEMLSSI